MLIYCFLWQRKASYLSYDSTCEKLEKDVKPINMAKIKAGSNV